MSVSQISGAKRARHGAASARHRQAITPARRRASQPYQPLAENWRISVCWLDNIGGIKRNLK
jgi:hypothetical protein